MKKSFKKRLKFLFSKLGIFKKICFAGVNGSLYQSENRTTLYTNLMAIWGMASVIPLVFFLEENNISASIYGPCYLILFFASTFIFKLNFSKKYLQARVLGLVFFNCAGWQAAILFGKSFNGYYIFFVALIYSIYALSKAPPVIRILSFSITFLALPINDYLSFYKITPITGLNSKDFSPSLIVTDSILISGFVAIMIFIEKMYSNQYELELNQTNENLEEIVRNRSDLLVKEKEKNLQVAVMKSQFLSNMSHELRIPIQGILGYVELGEKNLEKIKNLQQGSESQLYTSKLDRSFTQINQSIKRLLTLMEKLFKITESGQYKAHPSEHLLKDVINSTLDKIDFNSRTLKLIIDNNMNPTICTDIALLQQSLLLILNNAVNYSHKNTEIELSISTENLFYKIEIINQGMGVLEKEKELIFEPFFQGHLTEKGTGGTGIGLTLCQKYLKTIGGEIYLSDFRPERTCFVIKVPLNHFNSESVKIAS